MKRVQTAVDKAQEPCGGKLLILRESGRASWRRLLSGRTWKTKMTPQTEEHLELSRPSGTTCCGMNEE